MKLDDTKLADAFRTIYGQLTQQEAAMIVDVARIAASADGRMDLKEMGAIARLSQLLYSMAGAETNVPVPSSPADKTALAELASKLSTPGARELAYACAMLVMQTDLKVTKEEAALGTKLAETLGVPAQRASELAAITDALVRG